jgi:serine/threonine-protein kinase
VGAGAGAADPSGPTAAASPSPAPGGRAEPERTVTSMTPPAPPRPLTTVLEPGQVLAQRYRVQRLLGKGGMGAVYLADDEVLSELVALKVISSAFAADEAAMVARFRREAAAARKVSSPAVIRIHDLGEARPGLLYLSMEYFAGRTLAEVIAQRGLVPLDDARDILKQIAGGLEAAHQAGVIHRDLKPSNILVGERGIVKIIDFGLATTAMGEGLTATGAVLGTPHYMAPEQVRGKAVDARADIYSLGALAYHLVCGRPPFLGDNAIAIGFLHLSEPPPPPRILRKDCPANLEAAILAALAKSPDDRPSSARAFYEKATAPGAA